MAVDLATLCADLQAESAVLEAVLEPLDESGWHTPTPADGWDVLDQITHLAYFDARAALAATDPEAFRAERAAALADVGSMVERITAEFRAMTGAEALAWLRRERGALVAAVLPIDPSTRVPWYGPEMTIASSITARIMETWAHGVDVHDALGAPIVPSERLRHVAFLGVRAFANSFVTRALAVPDVAVRVELAAPGGGEWSFGPPEAGERVTGSALDFCLVATQRRHRDDTDLRTEGPVAEQWISIAQAFAGGAGSGREPLGR